MSNIELRAQIKLLRAQMANLEVKCQQREDKLMDLILALEPFLKDLPPEAVMKVLEQQSRD